MADQQQLETRVTARVLHLLRPHLNAPVSDSSSVEAITSLSSHINEMTTNLRDMRAENAIRHESFRDLRTTVRRQEDDIRGLRSLVRDLEDDIADLRDRYFELRTGRADSDRSRRRSRDSDDDDDDHRFRSLPRDYDEEENARRDAQGHADVGGSTRPSAETVAPRDPSPLDYANEDAVVLGSPEDVPDTDVEDDEMDDSATDFAGEEQSAAQGQSATRPARIHSTPLSVGDDQATGDSESHHSSLAGPDIGPSSQL